MKFKTGKHVPRHDKRTLRFARYAAALAPPPTSIDWTGKVTVPWGMMGNDVYGDCTCAAAGHLIMDWTANASTCYVPSDADILAAYNVVDGGTDDGADMLTVLNYWRQTGISNHKIDAFVQVNTNNTIEMMQAIDLFGGIYVGVALPDFIAQATNPLEVSWVVPPQGPVGNAAPDSAEGHCIPLIGYTSDTVTLITWGTAIQASWAFISAYADEAYGILSGDWIESTGEAPSGFDLQQLQNDLQAIQ